MQDPSNQIPFHSSVSLIWLDSRAFLQAYEHATDMIFARVKETVIFQRSLKCRSQACLFDRYIDADINILHTHSTAGLLMVDGLDSLRVMQMDQKACAHGKAHYHGSGWTKHVYVTTHTRLEHRL